MLQGREERRAAARHKLELKKIFSAELSYDSFHDTCYIYIVDVSLGEDRKGGIRITCDRAIPTDIPVHITFHLDEPFDATVQVSWGRDLEGGTHVYGMQFLDLDDEGVRAVTAFMDHWSPEARRRNFRLNHVIRVECESGGESRRMYVLALDFSPQGMKITSEQPFTEGSELTCRLFLDLDQGPVAVKARVQWQQPGTLGIHIVGLRFLDVTPETEDRINAYIDQVLSGQLMSQNVLPQSDFEDDWD